ncbi:unnamed protein product [Euphydryas editha]|uniref:Uncharacterized protein n=1 Tax=Euphydryas editha TaxID=104508 RepID=A0AAU9UFP1_EUPED|nr:unnamed protein product [Euphydryas editha]
MHTTQRFNMNSNNVPSPGATPGLQPTPVGLLQPTPTGRSLAPATTNNNNTSNNNNNNKPVRLGATWADASGAINIDVDNLLAPRSPRALPAPSINQLKSSPARHIPPNPTWAPTPTLNNNNIDSLLQ